ETDEATRLKGEVADWERKFTALEEELRTERVKGAVEKAARAAGVVEDAVSDAYALIDFAMLEFDDDGQPTNVEDAVKSLVKAKPYLTRQAAPAGDNDARRGKGGAPQQMTEAERQAFADRYGVQTQYIK
ncbi:MAG TPA: hypothetical protein VJ754_00850, partial [Anaerolineae bacterium]|nr:hypothetical protein [Anaerolineae bacterium]